MYSINIVVFLLTECVDKRFGVGTYTKNITILQKNAIKKCLDITKRRKMAEQISFEL